MIRHIFFTLTLCACAFTLRAQEPEDITNQKGARPASAPVIALGDIWAVVIGINDYKDEGISDLKFANRDVEAFVNYLKSPAGGQLDNEHIQVFLDEEATEANVANALYGLLKKVNVGDRVLFYFSGHGDVDTELQSKPGYLLLWNSSYDVYMSGGTLDVRDLQDIVSTLCESNQASVTLFIDACHSGTLAGGKKGAATTGASLAQQFSSESKFLSCQPNEISYESNQWGGGRGLFSYHLIDGLYGFADDDGDQIITLRELRRYLDDHVPEEKDQNPVACCDNKSRIGVVDTLLLAQIEMEKKAGGDILSMVASRGPVRFLSMKDTVPRSQYEAFNKALNSKQFFEPKGQCAEDLYVILIADERFAQLHDDMTHNYAAALQNDAQEAINDYLASDPEELRKRWSYETKYDEYPRYLARAAELLGKEHFMYKKLKVREYYFTGLNLRLKGERNKDKALYPKAIDWQMKALAIDPSASFAHNELGLLARRQGQYEESLAHFQKAIENSPKWVLPWANLCGSYVDLDRYEEAIEAGEKAVELDQDFVLAQYNLAVAYLKVGQYELSKPIFEELVNSNTLYASAYYQLGELYFMDEEYVNAEKVWLRYNELNPNDPDCYQNLGAVVEKLGKIDEALAWHLKVLDIDPDNSQARFAAAWRYLDLGQYASSEEAFKIYLKTNEGNPDAHYGLACVYALTNQPLFALDQLELSLKNNFEYIDFMKEDVRLKNIREHPRYQLILKKYTKAER